MTAFAFAVTALRWVWAWILPWAGPWLARVLPWAARAREAAPHLKAGGTAIAVVGLVAVALLIAVWVLHSASSRAGAREADHAWQTRLFEMRRTALREQIARDERIRARSDAERRAMQGDLEQRDAAIAELGDLLAAEARKKPTRTVCYSAAVARQLNK